MLAFRNIIKPSYINSLAKLNYLKFSSSSNDPIDSDDDFKKKTKVELTDENAQQILKKWVG